MGSALSTAGEKILGGLWNTITAPFSKSCEDECGEWDGVCFIENSCGASLLRLFKASILAIVTVVFLYIVLWKTGFVKCLVKNSCKLSWKAFWGSFRALGGACGCLWHKLRNTRRIYRGCRARRDVEMGELSWSDTDESGSTSVGSRKRARSPVSVRERRKDRMRQPLRVTSNKQISKVQHPAKRNRTEQGLHHGHHHRATGLRTEASSSLCVHGTMRNDRGRVHCAREH